MNENFRESLIYILKNAKIYLVDINNELEKVYDKKDIIDDANEKVENINILLNLDKINELIPNENSSNYRYLMNIEMSELDELLSKKALLINDDTTLEDISEQILNLDNPSYGRSLLYRLKKSKKDGIKSEYDFIRNN